MGSSNVAGFALAAGLIFALGTPAKGDVSWAAIITAVALGWLAGLRPPALPKVAAIVFGAVSGTLLATLLGAAFRRPVPVAEVLSSGFVLAMVLGAAALGRLSRPARRP